MSPRSRVTWASFAGSARGATTESGGAASGRSRERWGHGLPDDHLPPGTSRGRRGPDRDGRRASCGSAATDCSTCSCRTPPPGSRSSRPVRAATRTCSRRWPTCCPADDRWRHRHGSRGHGRSHVMPALVPPYATVPVLGGRLALGTWQSICLVDLNVDNPVREVRLSLPGRLSTVRAQPSSRRARSRWKRTDSSRSSTCTRSSALWKPAASTSAGVRAERAEAVRRGAAPPHGGRPSR